MLISQVPIVKDDSIRKSKKQGNLSDFLLSEKY